MEKRIEGMELRKNERTVAKVQMFFFTCLPSIITYAVILFMPLRAEAFIFFLIPLAYSYLGAWVCASSSMIVKQDVSLLDAQNLSVAQKQLKSVSACEEKDNPYMRLRVMRNVFFAVLLLIPVAAAGWVLFILYCCGKFLSKLSKMALDCDIADTMLQSRKGDLSTISECFRCTLRYAKTYNVLGEKKGFAKMLARADSLLQLWELLYPDDGKSEKSDTVINTDGVRQSVYTFSRAQAELKPLKAVTGKTQSRKCMTMAIVFILMPCIMMLANYMFLNMSLSVWGYGIFWFTHKIVYTFQKIIFKLVGSEIFGVSSIILFILNFLWAVVGAVYCALNMVGFPKRNSSSKFTADAFACEGKLQAAKSAVTRSSKAVSVLVAVLLSIAMILPVLLLGWLLFVLYCVKVFMRERITATEDSDSAKAVLESEVSDLQTVVHWFNIIADYAAKYKESGKNKEYAETIKVAEALFERAKALGLN